MLSEARDRASTMRMFLLVCAVALLLGCRRREESGQSAGARWPRFHEGRGIVAFVIPDRGRLVINHEAIGTIPMEAMVMNYRVEPADLLNGLNPGDSVRFRLKETERELFVVGIEKIAPPENGRASPSAEQPRHQH